jgi:hypothetical protein
VYVVAAQAQVQERRRPLQALRRRVVGRSVAHRAAPAAASAADRLVDVPVGLLELEVSGRSRGQAASSAARRRVVARGRSPARGTGRVPSRSPKARYGIGQPRQTGVGMRPASRGTSRRAGPSRRTGTSGVGGQPGRHLGRGRLLVERVVELDRVEVARA